MAVGSFAEHLRARHRCQCRSGQKTTMSSVTKETVCTWKRKVSAATVAVATGKLLLQQLQQLLQLQLLLLGTVAAVTAAAVEAAAAAARSDTQAAAAAAAAATAAAAAAAAAARASMMRSQDTSLRLTRRCQALRRRCGHEALTYKL